MASLWEKVLSAMGFEREEIPDTEPTLPEPQTQDPEIWGPSRLNPDISTLGGGRYEHRPVRPPVERNRGNVVSFPGSDRVHILVLEPQSFEEVQVFADNLVARRPVVLNFERCEKEIARRIVDFMSGVAYALGGTTQVLGGGIFLFAPPNFDITGGRRPEADSDKPGKA